MIHAILIYQENGTLLYSIYFSKIKLDPVLITGFTMAINQFGLKLFPEEDLEDIVFSRHHIFFQTFKLVNRSVIFLVIHDKKEEHYNLKKVNQQIYWELKQGFSHLFHKEIIDLRKLAPLKDRIEKIFIKERRFEKIL
ncbi:MAG: hypothetical protein ACTSRA_22135 [Promethearchaeota archaeon]